MKFEIKESKLKRIVYRYLEHDYELKTISEFDGNYSLCNEETTFCNIHYEKDDGICQIYYGLINEVSIFFSIDHLHSVDMIINYFQDKVGVKVKGWDYLYD